MNRSRVIAFCLGVLAASQGVHASTITLNVGPGGVPGDRIIGQVFETNDIQGGLLERDEIAIDALILVPLGTRTGTDPVYQRSTTNFALPGATQTGALKGDTAATITVVGTKIHVTLPSYFTYLMASYDGPNGGSEVWYIAGIAPGDTLIFPRFAQPFPNIKNGPKDPNRNLIESNKYGLTSWTLFNPYTPPPPNVPDGGSTAVLLGSAFIAVGMLRQKIGKR